LLWRNCGRHGYSVEGGGKTATKPAGRKFYTGVGVDGVRFGAYTGMLSWGYFSRRGVMLSVGRPVACDRADGVEASLLAPPSFICEYHPRLKSSQWGFRHSLKAIFLLRRQPLSCFSRSMAVSTVKGLPIEQAIHIVFTGETGRHVFFVLEQAILWGAGNPMYRVPDRLPIMQTK
jgi:hypothetical protein